MSRLVFWDVDTQYDFIYPDGRLYVKGAEEIILNLGRLTRYAQRHKIQVIGSVDYHSEEDEEISDNPDYEETFPPHCMKNTQGQAKIEATTPQNPLWIDYTRYEDEELAKKIREHRGEIYFRKRWFDVFSNPNTDKVLKIIRPTHIILYGVALDICDAYAVEGLLEREGYQIFLVSDAVKPIRREKGEELLKKWVDRGVKLTKTIDIVEGDLISRLVE